MPEVAVVIPEGPYSIQNGYVCMEGALVRPC